MSQLFHGGRLRQASEQHQIPLSDWLDLSTGVSPWTYPFSHIDMSHWNQLPQDEDGLEAAARSHFGAESLLAVAGSQMAIQSLPFVWSQTRSLANKNRNDNYPPTVGLPYQGYKEHEKAWLKAGWQVHHYDGMPTDKWVNELSALVVINPNNPSGVNISKQQLLCWQQTLLNNNGLLVVDEAFADIDNRQSLAAVSANNLVVLRSIGKFYGLAGIRVGFVIAPNELLSRLSIELGPWVVAGPSREVAKQALQDISWQKFQADRLIKQANRLAALLKQMLTNKRLTDLHLHIQNDGRIASTGLFQTLYLHNAKQVHEQLCQQAILVRLTDEEDALRFGLPKNDAQWDKLEYGLRQVFSEN
ncbi:threonine-phosphate decarboxylase [Shewanella algicola]|uniref:threonine-phosphate decarboxylase n=1 Tax=Shewanella algicola TaxID=640633 RepID=UPI002494AAA1|nr:pyridoxal phosphate-dependent class II aminotransferase [Shewanella algicola]